MSIFGPPNVTKLLEKRDIRGLIKALTYRKDASVRMNAVNALGEIAEPQAIEPLIATLKDTEAGVRLAAISALENFKDDRTIAPLLAALRDSVPDVRQQAAFALSKAKDKKVVNPLIASLNDSDANVKEAAAEALAKISRNNKDNEVKFQAAMGLAEIKDSRAISPLVDIAASHLSSTDHKGIEFRKAAQQALEDMGSSEEIVNALINCLSPHFVSIGQGKVRNQASSQNMIAMALLVRIGDPRAVEPIGEYLINKDMLNEDKIKAAWALATFDDPTVKDFLVKSIKKDRSQTIRSEVAEVLTKLGLIPDEIGDKANYYIARKDIEACVDLGKPAVEALNSMLDFSHRSDFPLIAGALGKIGDPAAVKPLLKAMEWVTEISNPEEFTGIVDGLLGIGEPAVDELISVLKKVNDPYNSQYIDPADAAASVLVKMGATQAIGPLVDILQKYGGRAGSMAEKRIGEFGSIALAELFRILENPPSYRAISGVAGALRQIGDKKAVPPLIKALKYDGHNKVDVIRQVSFALKKLTDQDFGNDHDKWEAWWMKENQ